MATVMVAPTEAEMENERLAKVRQEHVLQAAREMRPRRIQRWSVVVDLGDRKEELPAKQLMMEAANRVDSTAPRVTPADLIPHTAVRKLRRLGFEVRYDEEGL
jgi:hypothetical protein